MPTAPSPETGPVPRPAPDGSRGLELYHERTGSGPPLVLLHGAFGTIESCFAELRPRLARRFEVIAVELEGHGRTPALDRPLSYAQMAADTAALITKLGIAPTHLVGYSMGGAIGMQIALEHPGLVDRLVQFGGVSYSPDGNQPEPPAPAGSPDQSLLASLESSRWHRAYLNVAPDPDQWPDLVDKLAHLDDDFGGTPDQVRSLSRPTLLINGDADLTRPEHLVEMFRLLGGGGPADLAPPSPHRLAILPGTTHEGMLDQADRLDTLITAFLTNSQAGPPTPGDGR